MYDLNVPAHLLEFGPDGVEDEASPPRGGAVSDVDSELEAAIEYKLAVSGYAGVADIVELLNRAVRRRWVRGDWT